MDSWAVSKLRIPNGTSTDDHTVSWSSAFFAFILRDLPLRLRLPIFTLALLSILHSAG